MRQKNFILDFQKKLKNDSDYYYGWLSNIAMSMYDSFLNFRKISNKRYISKFDLVKICNMGAKNFLNRLIEK